MEAIPHAEDWSLPANFATALNTAGAQLTCVVNPHAPSGHLTPSSELGALAAALDGVLLIDEAYVDFVDPELMHDAVGLIRTCDNVLLLRTFSKGYALAGLRLGYLIGAESLITPILEKTRDSYNVDAISQVLGLAAIEDQAYAQARWADVRAERHRLQAQLAQLGFRCAASEANFLLADVPAPLEAATLKASLQANDILVRYFDHPRLARALRISIGTRDENEQLLGVLRQLVG